MQFKLNFRSRAVLLTPLLALSFSTASCSGGQSFLTIFTKSKNSKTVQPVEADIPRDSKTVGGVNLKASCLDLTESGRTAGTRAISCTISSSSLAFQGKFDRATLAATPESAVVATSGISGAPGADVSNWVLSSLAFVDLHFEVPEADYAVMKTRPVRLQLENFYVNGAQAAEKVLLEPSLQSYFTPHAGCGGPSEKEQIVDLIFASAGVSNTGSIFVPTTQPFDKSKVPELSRFCGAEFLDDLEFEWPVKTTEHRVAATLNGRWYAFTDLESKEAVLQFAHSFFVSRFFPGTGSFEEHLNRADSSAIGARKVWCPFGKEDCLSYSSLADSPAGEIDVIKLTALSSKFVAVNHAPLLDATVSDFTPFRIRFQNYPTFDASQPNVSPSPKDGGLVRLRLRFVE